MIHIDDDDDDDDCMDADWMMVDDCTHVTFFSMDGDGSVFTQITTHSSAGVRWKKRKVLP